MLTAAKNSLIILMISCKQNHSVEYLMGKCLSLISTLPTSLLQILCKINLNPDVIVKTILDPVDKLCCIEEIEEINVFETSIAELVSYIALQS